MACLRFSLNQLRQQRHGRSRAAMRLVRISFLTTASAEVVTKWFTPVVTQAGGTIKMVAWPPQVFVALPPEVAYEDLFVGWRYDLVALDADRATERRAKGRKRYVRSPQPAHPTRTSRKRCHLLSRQ